MAAFEWRPPPEGIVRAAEAAGRVEVSWRPPHARERLKVTLFLGFALSWFMLFEVAFTYSVVSEKPTWETIFVIAWVGAWTWGVVMLSRALWHQIRRPDLERVVIDGDTFTHTPAYRAPIFTRQRGIGLAFPTPWPKQALHRAAVSTLRLDRIRQRITYQAGDQCVEIGECLRNAEREWLAQLLTSWREDPRG